MAETAHLHSTGCLYALNFQFFNIVVWTDRQTRVALVTLAFDKLTF